MPKRQKALLGALAVLFLFLALRTGLRFASGGDLGLSLGRGSLGRVADAEFDMELAELRLADLDRRTRKLVLGRDPFRFRPRRRPPPPPRPRTAPPPPPSPPPAEPSGPTPPRFRLDYIGSFGPLYRKIAVFSDGKVIHNAMAGEVLDGEFIVDRIGFESVDIKYVDFPEVPALRKGVGG